MFERISSWWGGAGGIDDARWVVADVETSGLDPKRDRLLAIAAVAIHFDAKRQPRIAIGDSFESLLRQSDAATGVPDKDNILVHRIGVGAQRAGVQPAQALQDWAAYVGRSPLVGYHSAFDAAVIDRAARQVLPRPLAQTWLDLEPVCRMLHEGSPPQPLDLWLDRYGVQCLARHQAAADALATAQLLLRLWPAIQAERATAWSALSRLAASGRWVLKQG
jgi:DNA polymerase III subunit epsilon